MLLQVIWFLSKELKRNSKILSAIVFCLGTLSFLVSYPYMLEDRWWTHVFLLTNQGATYSMLLFAKAIFDDHFELRGKHWLFLTIFSIFAYLFHLQGYWGYFWDNQQFKNLQILIKVLPHMVEIVFVVLTAIEAVNSGKRDLIRQRIEFRKFFIFFISGISIILSLGAFSINRYNIPIESQLIMNSLVSLAAFLFLNFRLRFQNDFFIKPREETQAEEVYDSDIIGKLSIFINDQSGYKQENLTISKLAEILNVQEYKLRKTINQGLGFKNFNDYLNSFRIETAKQILSDPSQKNLTILEIAYSLGYNSISPFNKAFKLSTGKTPTEYRKLVLQ
ncbi:MAG: helix-turn-helix domain-containing protein [Flavobacteriales bacterium]|nr:helix-turn-helix domain-containing protein [Flavobacteriales bacterium]